MMNPAIGAGEKSHSLMSEYSSLLGDAILRHRARIAETSARVEAEMASQIKSEFIANMSHELRTPLNTIIGFSKLMAEIEQKPLAQADLVEYANLIQNAASHLLAVINDILDISKIQSGKFKLEIAELVVEELATATTSIFSLAANEAGVKIHIQIEPGLPVLNVDIVKMRQVMTNLVSNALKFTPEGGQIQISARRTSAQAIEIRVTDTGIGMSPEDVAVALTPFGQVDGSRSRWREGTGLGLPIANALIELHEGTLKIESAEGAGTSVILGLPIGSPQQQQPIVTV